MSVLATVISGLLGVAFLRAGVPKILRTDRYRERSHRCRPRAWPSPAPRW